MSGVEELSKIISTKIQDYKNKQKDVYDKITRLNKVLNDVILPDKDKAKQIMLNSKNDEYLFSEINDLILKINNEFHFLSNEIDTLKNNITSDKQMILSSFESQSSNKLITDKSTLHSLYTLFLSNSKEIEDNNVNLSMELLKNKNVYDNYLTYIGYKILNESKNEEIISHLIDKKIKEFEEKYLKQKNDNENNKNTRKDTSNYNFKEEMNNIYERMDKMFSDINSKINDLKELHENDMLGVNDFIKELIKNVNES